MTPLTWALGIGLALCAALLFNVMGRLERAIGDNIQMAKEYYRLAQEYKQYRADVVESLGKDPGKDTV